ncbi:hypothetical protein O7608_02505 [Solwaraspora sp. WMMA2056]|nr:hypothetical protein [Solwaraspora sp. WMMA2056]WJK41329.1 hypothetical protein O7608_02505 [Solwaraspora sp. WMMA2056]
MQRQQALLAELGVPHHQDTGVGVEVAVIGGQRLAQTHAGDREQPDERAHSSGAQRCLQRLGLL